MPIRPPRWLNIMQKNTRRMTTVIGVILIIFLSAVTALSGRILYDWALEDWQEDLHGFAAVLSENTSQTMASAYLVLDSIVVDESNSATIYVAAWKLDQPGGGGGLWISHDAGRN